MGVAIFFIVSGFIITHVALRESRVEFLVKRTLRIYPPLIVATLIACACTLITSQKQYSLSEILTAFTLTNYWSFPEVRILGVAWTLAIEIIFYGLTLALLPLLKRTPIIAVLLQLGVIWAIFIFRKDYGHSFFLFAASAAYIPYLIMGQITYFLYSKTVKPQTFGILLIATYTALLQGIQLIHKSFSAIDNSYLISFAYAYFIFIMCLLLKDHIKPGAFTKLIADSSYSIYLLHGTVGITFLVLLSKHTSINSATTIFLSSLAASALSIATAWVFFQLIEKPSIRAARHICKAINTRKPTAPKDYA